MYEAGKMAKSGHPPQVPVFPYYVPGVPAVVSVAPSSHLDPKISSIPSMENNLAGGECQRWMTIFNLLTPEMLPATPKLYSINHLLFMQSMSII